MGTQSHILSPAAPHRVAARTAVRPVPWEQRVAVAYRAGAAVLLACVAAFVWRSRDWPLVNDAALMHYVVFLTGKGLAPYRQLGDYNLPGSYLPEWLAMAAGKLLHVSSAAMWRLFDLGALAACGWAMVRISRRVSWFAGVWAGALLALLHARDGIGQAGQRDLWMTLLLLWAVALLFYAIRRPGSRAALPALAGFGMCVAAAATIKPPAALWYLCLAALPAGERGTRRRAHLVAACALGSAVPVLGMLAWLGHYHAVGAFWRTLTLDLPYHLSLARQPLSRLAAASLIPSLVKLSVVAVAAWCAVRVAERTPRDPVRHRPGWGPELCTGLRISTGGGELPVLLLCTLLGFASFALQGKGYTYQRYPFQAFLLLTVGLVLARAVQAHGWPARSLGLGGLAFGVFFCAPGYLHAGARAHWPTGAVAQMESSIRDAAGPGDVAALDGRVQCIDTVSGCTDALLALRLKPATGLFYDEMLFPESALQTPGPDAPIPEAVAVARWQFVRELTARPPQVILLSSWLFPEGPGDYSELASWPWLAHTLATRYTLAQQRSYPRAENGPLGFRVYVLRPANNPAVSQE